MQLVDRAVWSGPLVLLQLEGAASFAAFVAAYGWSGHSWRMFALLLLAYLANSRVGAVGYNLAACRTEFCDWLSDGFFGSRWIGQSVRRVAPALNRRG